MDNIEYLTTEQNRHQLMIGLNMYAMSYSPTRAPEPLVMKTVVEKLSNQPKTIYDELMDNETEAVAEELNWDKPSQEAWFIDIDEDGTRQGTVWLPTFRVSMQSTVSCIVCIDEFYISLLKTESDLLKIMEVSYANICNSSSN